MPISVAIIDSGVDPLSLREVCLHQCLRFHRKGQRFRATRSLTDPVGHGTACADLISRLAPDVSITSLAITDETGSFDPDALIEAIDWCTHHQIQVVNISLGTTDASRRSALEQACDRAASAGVLIIAAEQNDGVASYPAHCTATIGVCSGSLPAGGELIYRPGHPVQCVARGDHQRVRWHGGGDRMVAGSSFAAPRVTAMVARMLQESGGAQLSNIHRMLRQSATIVQTAEPQEGGAAVGAAYGTRAALYPYTKEMHALIRFRDLLPFQITGVADPPGRRCVGRDAGEVTQQQRIGLPISASLPRALMNADLLVLGYVRKLGTIQRRDVQREAVTQALDVSASVFAFEAIDAQQHADLHRRAASIDCSLREPGLTIEEARTWLQRPVCDAPVDRPVLGVFGTSSAQGKFTLQLELRRQMIRQGYRVGQLGTEHHAELFGLDLSFPMGYDSRVELPLEYWPEYLDCRLRDLCASREPDLIIVGSQSGTVPYDVQDPRTLTLASLAFLVGTKPDVCILVVNAHDEDAYIRATIQSLEGLSQTRVIALAVSDRAGQRSPGTEPGEGGAENDALRSLLDRLARIHQRRAFCIGDADDIQRLTQLVIGVFATAQRREAA